MHGGYKCPSCGMMAGHKMGAFLKSSSNDLLGKIYKCENCKYMW